MNYVELALNIIMPGGFAISAAMLYRARSERRSLDAQTVKTGAETTKTGADAAAVISETALELLAPLRAELRAAHEEIADLRTEVRSVRAELDEYHRRHGPLSA